MTTLSFIGSEPAEGTINGRHVGIYVSDEDTFVLTLFEQNSPGEFPPATELASWIVADKNADLEAIAKEILHDDLARRLINNGTIKPTRQ